MDKSICYDPNFGPNTSRDIIYIYVLQCDLGKYYVGRTLNPRFSIKDCNNINHKGIQWINYYKPRYLVEILRSNDTWDEDKITLKYMDKYGIENVRGGAFSTYVLSSDQIQTIQYMISCANGKCNKCNKIGHYISQCPFNTKYTDYEVILTDKFGDLITNEFTSNTPKFTDVIKTGIYNITVNTNTFVNNLFGIRIACKRCGIRGHTTDKCTNDITDSQFHDK